MKTNNIITYHHHLHLRLLESITLDNKTFLIVVKGEKCTVYE